MPIEPIFVSVQEAADALNITRWPMQKLLKSGAVQSKVIGRRRLVSVDSLREYADALPTSHDQAAW